MLIDLHAHSSGISTCCRIDAAEVIKRAGEAGLDGIVLTNHYQKSYIGDGDVQDFVKRYVDEFYYAEECGRNAGCKVFFGIEVTMERYPAVHMLVYGVNESFLTKHPTLFDYSQQELYSAVKESGGVLIQAHPFRNGAHVLDVKLLDGVEINCHPLYGNSYSEELIRIAGENGLMLTCGGDYHADTYRPRCGTVLPDGISNGIGIGKFLLETGSIKLCIHEPNTETPVEVEFFRR